MGAVLKDSPWKVGGACMESAVAREETRRLIVGALKARLEAAMESIVSVVCAHTSASVLSWRGHTQGDGRQERPHWGSSSVGCTRRCGFLMPVIVELITRTIH
tara:strand:- start:300 stop:608 length:309 start_codon:yes stop_codon:yes gene_type:complete